MQRRFRQQWLAKPKEDERGFGLGTWADGFRLCLPRARHKQKGKVMDPVSALIVVVLVILVALCGEGKE